MTQPPMKPERFSCRQARSSMERAFDGSLPVEEHFALEAHGAACERCGQELLRLQALQEALMDLPAAPAGGLDVEAALRAVGQRIDEQGAARHGQPFGARPRRLAPLAAAAAAALVLVVLQREAAEPQPGSGIDAGGADPGAQLAVAPELAPEGLPGAGSGGTAPADVGTDTETDPQPAATGQGLDALAQGGSSAGAGGESQPSLSQPAPSNYDPARRAEVLALVAERLDQSLGQADPKAAELPWAEVFLASTDELGQAGWPLEGLLRSVVDEPADARQASAALRVMGLLGGRLAAAEIEQALAQPALAMAGAQALADLGPMAFEGLGRAWWRPELRPALQLRAEGLPAVQRRELVDVLLRVAPRSGERRAATSALAGLLASAGYEGLQDLVRLADRPEMDREQCLAALRQAEPDLASAALQGLLGDRQVAEATQLAAAGALAHPDLLPWVLQRTHRGRERETAARALASFGSLEALAGMLELEAERRLDPGAFLEAWTLATVQSPEAVAQLAIEYSQAGDLDMARRLLDLCVSCPAPEALAAGLELCASGLLSAAERRDGLLALGERAVASDLPELQRLLQRLESGDGDVAAAALLVARSAAGHGALEGLLLGAFGASLPTTNLDRILRRLSSGKDSDRRSIYTLRPLLEPSLATRGSLLSQAPEDL